MKKKNRKARTECKREKCIKKEKRAIKHITKHKSTRPVWRRKKTKKVVEDLSHILSGKFLGYCKKCGAIVSNNELKSKFIYVCTECHYSGRISALKKESIRSKLEKEMTKKEYMQSSIGVDYHDMPILRPKSVKVDPEEEHLEHDEDEKDPADPADPIDPIEVAVNIKKGKANE